MHLQDLPAAVDEDLLRHASELSPRAAGYWRQRAGEYILAQTLPGHRKSMQPLADRLGTVPYDQMQQFITDSPWDWDATQFSMIDVIREDVGDPNAFLVIDDTSMPKQGTHSVGVAHQYCGVLGKAANCQTGVLLTYARLDRKRNADSGIFPLGL